MKKYWLLSILTSFLSMGIYAQNNDLPKREFRGVWVATVVNIDWPSKPGLTTDQQKQEFIALLDKHKQEGINAIMFQIRPATDSFYAKSNEPWSQYLTGKQGQAPDPFYDPLQFAIEECHKRGMELHAWFNPYRATFDANDANIVANHITKTKPEWFFKYDGKKLFNPGIPEVRAYINKIIINVVDNYDIDGVHFDDYFYPYSVKGQFIDDDEAFKKYNNGISDIKDWRRNNVDLLIKELNDSIHAHKKYIKFGVSPFGIWKNKSQDPEGSISYGGDSYYGIYADARKWVKEGWVDYINPQIYWAFETKAAPYANLVDWWSDNTYGRHLYIGIGAYKVNATKELAWKNPTELSRQIAYYRNNPRVQGCVFFSSRSLTKNPLGIADTLANNYFKYPALPPLMLWLDSVAPNPPQNLLALQDDKGVLLSWKQPLVAKDGDKAYGFVVYRFDKDSTINLSQAKNIKMIYYGNITSFEDTTAEKGKIYSYVVTTLDRVKNESEPSIPVLIGLKN
ncbi:family 10 glycosylhydrolase [Pedobacter sp. SD-b]|uniref:Family 10 glycosylhydrolase n=1 Tax=Pedobacter segetis TaxID=2793069 RepID=A0ABS1BLM0_9SPHI|nr:family 10 glycosylhydrolase [Pedobacter segetis]MBK0383795.1 family 10 glycosylhydrolase [Pedobacter segetis]